MWKRLSYPGSAAELPLALGVLLSYLKDRWIRIDRHAEQEKED